VLLRSKVHLKFFRLVPIDAGMKTTITKAQAEAILDAANALFNLVLDAREIDEFSPEGRALYDKIVEGAIAEVMPDATYETLMELLDKPEVSH
jgi:hypothetical protein